MSLQTLCCTSVVKFLRPVVLLTRPPVAVNSFRRIFSPSQRFLAASDSSADGNSNSNINRKAFRSLLSDSNVTSPFEDPSRQRRRRTLTTSSAMLKSKTSDEDVQSTDKKSIPELDELKKKLEELIKEDPKQSENTNKSTKTATQNKKSAEDLKGGLEDEPENSLSSLGGSTTTTLSAYRRFWKRFHKMMGTEVDENATYEERRRQKMARNTKMGSLFLVVGSFAGFVWFCIYYGRPKRDEKGQKIQDEFSGTFFGPFYRIMNSFKLWKDYVVEPSREVLLPDPLPPPYLQPKYTLVIEMKNVLIAPEWTYKTGHRFVKRPALDYFLDIVGYPNFEVVIYTSESSMTAPQVIESFDPKQRIMYKLYRDCTKYMNGHHVKDLSRLNRDLSKVIYIDFDPKSFQLNPDNVLRIPKWDGDMDDTSLVDLAELLKTIHLSDVEDVRPTLQYYSQFDDPAKEFRRRAMYIAEQDHAIKEQQDQQDHSMVKRYSGRLFGYRRHA